MKNNETQMSQNNDFDGLVAHIQQTQDVLQNNARLVINRHVTAKAWLTGYYIVEYEQKGADRAKYGEQLLKKLAEKLKDKKTFSYRSLNIYRKFYLTYPALNDQIKHFVLSLPSIVQTVSALFHSTHKTLTLTIDFSYYNPYLIHMLISSNILLLFLLHNDYLLHLTFFQHCNMHSNHSY